MNLGNHHNWTHALKQTLLIVPFFVCCTLYLWLVTEPRLIYHAFGTIIQDTSSFLTGIRFFKNTMSLPGGLVVYVSGLLSQGFAWSGLGAVIIAAVGFGLYEGSRRHLESIGHSWAQVTSTVLPIALVLITSRYEHPLPEALACFLGLLSALAFERLPLHGTGTRLIGYSVFATFGYLLMGAGGLLVFSGITCVTSLCVHKQWRFSIILWGIGALIIWLSAEYVFLIPPQHAFVILTPISSGVTQGMKPFSSILILLMTAWVPCCMLLQCLANAWCHKTAKKQKSTRLVSKKTPSDRTPHSGIFTFLKPLVSVCLPFILLGTGLSIWRNPMTKPFMQAHAYAHQRQWNSLLELGGSLPKGQSNVFVSHDIIRALYHTGRLPYDLFQFPQTSQAVLLTHEKTESYLTQFSLCDLFIELGQVNLAEKMASELLAVKGHNGAVLEQLARINIYKTRYDTARVYLHTLQKDLVYGKAAGALLANLDQGFQPDQQTHLDAIRSIMCHDPNAVSQITSAETILISALEFNPHNKMAFEYLMTCYLLTGQIHKIAANEDRFKQFNYTYIPTLYAEAILLYTGLQKQNLDLTRFNIPQDTIQRYIRFVQLKNSMTPQNRSAVLNRLIKDFGQSYLFYFTFGRVGLV